MTMEEKKKEQDQIEGIAIKFTLNDFNLLYNNHQLNVCFSLTNHI